MTQNPNIPEPTREDVIIGRIVDGEASPGDWQDLDRIAEKDAQVWQRLARSQRAHARLERAVEDEIAVAELVDLPLHSHHAMFDFVSRVRTYGGWAVAAVLALALIGAYNPLSSRSLPGAGNQAGLLSNATPEQAYNHYVESGRQSGRILEEMPPMLIDAQGLDSGQTGDVVIIRRIVERIGVKDMYIVEPNEFGHPTPAPIQVRQSSPQTPAGL